MLELVILGLLKEGPLHGYDLRKRIRENFRPLANLSFGSLYPALGRLESSGAVRSMSPESTPRRGAEEAFVPFTGSLGGERAATAARRASAKAIAFGAPGARARKVYEITEQGEETFEALLQEAERQDPDLRSFSLRLAFARHLSQSSRIRLLERRRLELADRLEQSRASLANHLERLDRFGRSIAEHTCDTLALDLSWVEALLEQEDDQPDSARDRQEARRSLMRKGTST